MGSKMDEVLARLERTERLEQQHRDQLRSEVKNQIEARRWEHSAKPSERIAYETERHRKNYEWKNFYAPVIGFFGALLLVKLFFFT